MRDESGENTWIKRSSENSLLNRLVWVAGDSDDVENLARQIHRSKAMVKRYQPRRDSLELARKLLLQAEDIRTRPRAAPTQCDSSSPDGRQDVRATT